MRSPRAWAIWLTLFLLPRASSGEGHAPPRRIQLADGVFLFVNVDRVAAVHGPTATRAELDQAVAASPMSNE